MLFRYKKKIYELAKKHAEDLDTITEVTGIMSLISGDNHDD